MSRPDALVLAWKGTVVCEDCADGREINWWCKRPDVDFVPRNVKIVIPSEIDARRELTDAERRELANATFSNAPALPPSGMLEPEDEGPSPQTELKL